MAEEAQYKIAFSEHPVHENLKQLKQQVAGLPDELLATAREHDAPALLPRLQPALEFIGALLASADNALVTQHMLDDLNEAVQQISSALTPFKDNTDFEQLPTIQSGVEALLNRSLRIAPAIGVWAKTDARKAAAQLGEASSEKTRQLQHQASDLQGQLNQLQEEAAQASGSLKAETEERINQLQSQLNTLHGEANNERDKIQGALDEFRNQFDSEQASRNAQFEENKQEFSGKVAQVIEEFKAATEQAHSNSLGGTETAIAEIQHRGDKAVAVLDEQKEKATRLVELISTGSTAGAFNEEAKEQKMQADRWRNYAILGGAVAVAVALAAVVFAVEGIGGTPLIIAKAAAVTLLLGIAGYAAGQSGQHRRREQRAKRLELELIAFDPFIEPLPSEEKNAVRKEFIERLFVGDPGEEHKEGEIKLSDENLSVLAKLMDMVRPGSP